MELRYAKISVPLQAKFNNDNSILLQIMDKRKRWNLLGFAFTILFTLIIIGVIYIALSCKNELQNVARVLLVMSIVGAFAVIKKNIRRNCNKQIK